MKRLLIAFIALATLWSGFATTQTNGVILIPSEGKEGALFGASVSINGDYAIVGAPGEFAGTSGSAFIFNRDGESWMEQVELTNNQGDGFDQFGISVSISGEYAIVGAPQVEVNSHIGPGAAFIFMRDGTDWVEQAMLTPSDGARGDAFGSSVAIDGDYAIIGAVDHNPAGSAYIFMRVGARWVEQATLTGDGLQGGLFGNSVAISGDYALVGQPEAPAGGPGSAYIFTRNGTTWTQQVQLTASDGAAFDDFGWSVAIDGEHAIVGAPGHSPEDPFTFKEGAGYVFERIGTNWVEQVKLRPTGQIEPGDIDIPNTAAGFSVAISGSFVILGAIGGIGPTPAGLADTGAAYLYSGAGANWTGIKKLVPANGSEIENFGAAVSIDGDCPMVGAPQDDPLDNDSGSAYMFCGLRQGPPPGQAQADLIIHTPKVIDPDEPAVSDEVGAQTFVNLDNDDQDSKFDFDDPDGIIPSGGTESVEDELCLLEVRLTPAMLDQGMVTIEATSGADNINVWENADRTGAFGLPGTLQVPDDFEPEGDARVKKLWIEGIEPHTTQQGTKLKMTYEGPSECAGECTDEIALTILGVKHQAWLGRRNGFTPPPSTAHNSNTLDEDPNFPTDPGLPKSNRVFTGARAGNVNEPRDTVDLQVELTVAPIETVNLYVMSFDCDDPATDIDFIDPNDEAAGAFASQYPGTNITWTKEEDNRGGIIFFDKAGTFTGQDSDRIATLMFTPSDTTKKIEFKTSHHPGDNYRAVVNGDKDFLKQLRNRDHDDGFRIVEVNVEGSADDREVPDAFDRMTGQPIYASNVLGVWRLLHVENDSMEAVPDSGPERNQVEGNIVDLSPSAGPYTQVTVDNNLNDGSGTLDNPVTLPGRDGTLGTSDDVINRNGRFENGVLFVAGTTLFIVDGNGDEFIERAAGISFTGTSLPFAAIDNDSFGNSTMSGTVTDIVRSDGEWILPLDVTSNSEDPIDWPDFIGGTIAIGGGPGMSITDTIPGVTSVVVAGLRIPYTLTDDDDMTLLPSFSSLSGLDAFKAASVLFVDDGGGRFNNDQTVPFVLNVPFDEAGLVAIVDANRGSAGIERDVFWGAYVISAYQFDAFFRLPADGRVRGDGDPDKEPLTTAITPPFQTTDNINIAVGGDGSLMFREAERDTGTNHPRNVAHEVGHQFGLGHGQVGLMHPFLRDGDDFTPASINLIRSRVRSPGEQ